jgi:hypothetical protein
LAFGFGAAVKEKSNEMRQLKLSGQYFKVHIDTDLGLKVIKKDGALLWESSKTKKPVFLVEPQGAKKNSLSLASATGFCFSNFNNKTYRGHQIELSGYEGTDAVIKLIYAVNSQTNELMIQAEQIGGEDTVVNLSHFYRFEKPTVDGGYMVLPHGSGYLIPADCKDELPGDVYKFGLRDGLIGCRWTLPVFGMVKNDGQAMCTIIESWWDCETRAYHQPNKFSALDFNWMESLGNLSYPRRFTIRFAENMNYVDMAKLYRKIAKKQGLVKTLKEKIAELPAVETFMNNIVVRKIHWNDGKDNQQALNDLKKIREMGLGITFFYPKWGTETPLKKANWQSYLLEKPTQKGWQPLVDFNRQVKDLDAQIMCFINPNPLYPQGPYYDQKLFARRADGKLNVSLRGKALSMNGSVKRMQILYDNLDTKGFSIDAMYFDGYSAYPPMPEDFSKENPISRKQGYELQNACMAESRKRGIVPGAEAARFWAIKDCDYFYFTDWARDRLTNVETKSSQKPVGIPIPLIQLVFHECYFAGHSGGGYAIFKSGKGLDWWDDYNPRLYELLFASHPAHNWLPAGYVPVKQWQSQAVKNHFSWLEKWSRFYRAIATSQMVSHEFLSDNYKKQRTKFANGTIAEFDMEKGLYSIKGIEGFTGSWEKPEQLFDPTKVKASANKEMIDVTIGDKVVTQIPCERIEIFSTKKPQTNKQGRPINRPEANAGRTKNGDIYAALVGTQRLYKSTDGGKNWTSMPLPPLKDYMAAFTVLADDSFLLIRRGPQPVLHTVPAALIWRSTDYGKSWHEFSAIASAPFDGMCEGLQSFTQLKDGTVLFPTSRWTNEPLGYHEPASEGKRENVVFFSKDNGKTWPQKAKTFDYVGEPQIIELQSGKLLGAFRFQRYRLPEDTNESIIKWNGDPDGKKTIFKHLCIGESFDKGLTWENLTPVMDKDGNVLLEFGECHGQLAQVPDGRVVLIHDHRYPYNKARTIARISEDEGKTWSKEAYQVSFGSGYPAIFVLEDETIVVITGNTRLTPPPPKPIGGKVSAQVIHWKLPTKE